jgi:plastocyanin
MRRPLVALSLLTLALALSACASSTAPGWTYAPPTPSPSPGPSTSAGPSAEASAAPSAGGSAAASAAPSTGSNVVNITALNIAWTQTEVSAPGNVAFTIHFDNQDASTPHNIVIKDGTGMAMFTGDIVTGPAQKDYPVPALAPGKYTFVCSVHSGMIGNLTVGQ